MKKQINKNNPIVKKENLISNNSIFNFSSDDKICLSLLLIVLVFVFIVRSKFAMIPFERDEGAYGYYGKLLLEGKTPYIDFYEQKFPGIFYFYGLMVFIFGDTVKGLHNGFMYLNLLTIIFIYFSSKKIFSSFAGLISATTFAFLSLTPNLSGFTVQSEHGVAFFISLGILFYSYTNIKQKIFYFLMGLAMGCSFMIKTSGMFLVLWGGFILILDFYFVKEKQYKNLFINVLIYSLGVFSVIGILFAIIAAKGSFNEMIFWTYEIPKNYISKIPFDDGVKYFGYSKDAILQNHKFFWYQSIVSIVLLLIKSIDLKIRLFGVTLLIFSFFTIVPGFYFYGHYWIMLLPGVSLAAGLTYQSLITIFKTRFNINFSGLKYIYVSIFALLIFSHLSAMKQYYFKPNYEKILRNVYGNNPFPESMEIGNWINANSKPEDKIVLLGSEPQIYFYTKKHSPSRHAYFAAIVDNVPQHKVWQREFVKDVEKANPKYLIYFNHPISLFVQPNTDQYVFEWANKYVNANYHLVGLVDMIEGQHATYLWREQIGNYKPVSQNIIYVYERNQ